MNAARALQDVAIVGAGPVGLTLACALADQGLAVTVVERQKREALAAPAPDGREIALTHRSAGILRALGLWQRLPEDDVAPIREARVVDGASPRFLQFEPRAGAQPQLGFMVPNHRLRRAAFEAFAARPSATLVAGARVERVHTGPEGAEIRLADAHPLRARLIVAADSRMSDTRRQMGIGAELRDFGRDVIVCHLTHELPSDGIAWECFGYERTLAILPLNDRIVSAVVTVESDRAEALLRLPPEVYASLVREQFGDRLGAMRMAGERHSYPLVAVYAHRFTGLRFALAGDAAVGMHPVTAHGFNLGLYGIESLARAIRRARAAGADIGAEASLAPYAAEHRRATRPLYLATNAVVGLFTDNRPPARLARAAVLGLASRLPPLTGAIERYLGAPP